LETMTPRREVSSEDSIAFMFTPIEDLVLALHELLQIQQLQTPTTMHMDTRFHFPKFVDQMNRETIDS